MANTHDGNSEATRCIAPKARAVDQWAPWTCCRSGPARFSYSHVRLSSSVLGLVVAVDDDRLPGFNSYSDVPLAGAHLNVLRAKDRHLCGADLAWVPLARQLG